MKHNFNLKPLARTGIKALVLAFLVFILPGWSSRTFLIAQTDPTKASSEATASAAPTEIFPPATDLPEPTKDTTPEPQPTKDAGGIGIASGQWVVIASQNFEGVFPATGWTVQDLSNDGFERFWDDDNYRSHLGAWAGWPTRGGANGLNPVLGNDNYFNNMTTRMIYGPFNLSDASRADTDFYLWRELEENYDYLAFEISHDGISFQELARWTTTSKVWEFKDIYYDSFVGDSSVWIAWRFYSDYSITHDGPWLDDVHVWKFLPNSPTATPTRTATRTTTMTRTPTRTPPPGPIIPRIYLPVVMKDYEYMKSKSGLHLGSGVQANWSTLMQTRLTGGNPAQGIYPAVLVVLSNNLYTYTRGGPTCTISAVSGVTNQALYDYLKSASQQGTKVIVRIHPSPGNFKDSLGASGVAHDLLTDAGQRPTKSGGGIADYCSDPIPGDGESRLAAADYFRSIDDIANEMKAIRDYNSARGWSVYAFEPANEPNAEWWPKIDYLQVKDSWVDMDTYFKNLYYIGVHPGGANPDIRVLAVPMAQSLFAEDKNIVDCTTYSPQVEGRAGGLLWMENTWLENVNGSPVNYNDGWSWHNYWTYTEEAATADNTCNPSSGHNFQVFPASLKTTILNSPDDAFITEADLYASCQPGDPSPLLMDKGGSLINSDGANAAQAVEDFIRQERGADYVAIWNLTVAYSDSPTCHEGNDEQAWHEAYRGADSTATNTSQNERYWFLAWWLDVTQP